MKSTFYFYLVLFLLLCTTYVHAQQNREECQQYDRDAMNLYYAKQYKEALVYIEKLIVCDPNSTNYYNAACIASLDSDKKKGFLYLKEAIKQGYSDSIHMNNDEDLAYLKSLKEWKQTVNWMAEVRNRLYKEIAKIHVACPATDLIPYEVGEKWGYLDRKTKHKITEPVFDQVSFVGKTGQIIYGDREILFSCTGEIIREEPVGGRVRAYYDLGYVSSEKLNKGFHAEKGKIKQYAYTYRDFAEVSVNYGQLFAIVQTSSGTYSLIDSTGMSVYGIEGYKRLDFYNYGMDSEYFPEDDRYNDFYIFYIDSLGNVGLFNHDFEKKTLPDISAVKAPDGNGFEREYLHQIRGYLYMKKHDKWGIWNCYKMQWVMEPEYDEILYTERTYDGNYEDDYYTGNTIALYFMVKQNGREFFIDKENVKYIPE